ncbi:FAD/NAD(P)-binding domain-containing protein [Neurospora tetraspora]|uniref:FAD/NAD(P)-binding domain-containing protein n=1 Tax=Neurospora tetraspora TaxID=94610 RepID=A0AAE0JGY9_9PEZI|nr:FAD/NAD(P)-binding domain-containing protein [Neurospora tetraspora]
MDALASQPPVCSSTTRLPDSQRHQIKVAIIGGGICGTALAAGLLESRYIDCHIYEKVPMYRDVGAGLSLHKNAIGAMKLINPELFNAYQKKAVDIAQENQEMATEVILAAGKHKGLKVGELGRARGRKSVSRADLLEGFLELVPKENISFGKQVVKIWETHHGSERSRTDSVAPCTEDSGEYDHPIHIEFADGSRAHADVLIGCDGIHSSVRAYLLGEDHPATKPKNHDGWQIYRTLIPTKKAIEKWGVDEKLTQTVPILLGPNGHINIIPMKNGKMLSAGVAVRGAARPDTAIGPSSVPASAPASTSTVPPTPPDTESGVVPWVWYAALNNTTVGDLFTYRTNSSTPANPSPAPPAYQTQPPNSLPGQGTPKLNPYLYKDYTREAQKIVCMVAADTSASWAVADHDNAPYYARGCVAMAGDAAHAALPFAGNGAAQALEDAAVLAHLLRTYVRTPEMAETALWAYEKVRMERSQNVVEIARQYGRVYSFNPVQHEGKWAKLHEKPEVMMQWFRQQAAVTNEFNVELQNEWAERLFVTELALRGRARMQSSEAEGSQGTHTQPKTKTDEVKNEEVSNMQTMGEGTSPTSTWVSLETIRGGEEGENVERKEAGVVDGEDGEHVEREEANDDDMHDMESVASFGQDSDYDFVDDYMDDADDELEDEEEDGSDL